MPWRVEGARREGDQGAQRPRLFGPRFWLALLGLLVLNWVLSALLVRAPERTEVPYTLRWASRGLKNNSNRSTLRVF